MGGVREDVWSNPDPLHPLTEEPPCKVLSSPLNDGQERDGGGRFDMAWQAGQDFDSPGDLDRE